MHNMSRVFYRSWFYHANNIYILTSVVRILPTALAVDYHFHSGLMGTYEPNIQYFGNVLDLCGDVLGPNRRRDVGYPDWGLSWSSSIIVGKGR
jgi:hypothetical protein